MKACHLLRALCASPKVGLASVPAVEQHPVAEEQPIYLKPSRGKYRKPSFVIPRMKGELPAYAYRAPPLGSAAPMFCITSASCEYFALRLPILKAGFKRIPVQTAPQIPSNLLWGRSLFLRPPNSLAPAMGGNFDVAQSVIPTDASAACADGSSTLKMICAHQRFNHFPRTYGTIGCKLGLTLRLRHAVKSLELGKGKHGLYNFFPRTWVFPEEKESVKLALLQAKPTQRFIWKPARGSCGRGIFICPGGPKNAKYWEDIVQKMEKRVLTSSSMVNRNYVVQEYIDDPLLLDGRKMDLRLYVAVTSYDPLTIYLHEEGLVRLAVQQYGDGPDASANDCGAHEGCTPHFEPFRDLTNYSVGRKWVKRGRQGGSRDDHVDDVEPLSSEEQGDILSLHLKKSMADLWAHIDSLYLPVQQGMPSVYKSDFSQPRPSDRVWESIAQVIVKTLLAVKSPMARGVSDCTSSGGFFELYGFDMMLDSKLNPWLIEVNTLPSLASTSPFDYTVKTNVISDLLNLAMIEPFERPMECFMDLADDSWLKSSGLCDPLTSEAADSVHRWGDHCSGDKKSILLRECEQREELRLRLQDELTYCRGFRRIFPPLPTRNTAPLPLSELGELASNFNLTKADMWALEM